MTGDPKQYSTPCDAVLSILSGGKNEEGSMFGVKVFVLACNLCVKEPCSPGGWLNTHLPWQVGN